MPPKRRRKKKKSRLRIAKEKKARREHRRQNDPEWVEMERKRSREFMARRRSGHPYVSQESPARRRQRRQERKALDNAIINKDAFATCSCGKGVGDMLELQNHLERFKTHHTMGIGNSNAVGMCSCGKKFWKIAELRSHLLKNKTHSDLCVSAGGLHKWNEKLSQGLPVASTSGTVAAKTPCACLTYCCCTKQKPEMAFPSVLKTDGDDEIEIEEQLLYQNNFSIVVQDSSVTCSSSSYSTLNDHEGRAGTGLRPFRKGGVRRRKEPHQLRKFDPTPYLVSIVIEEPIKSESLSC